MIELVPFFFLVLYLIPFMVAVARNHDLPGGVLVVNLLLGWTVVGWLGALVWALGPTHATWTTPPRARDGLPDVVRARHVMPRILDSGTRE